MYAYEEQKKYLFEEEGQRTFLKIRDKVNNLLDKAGACTMQMATNGVTGSDWFHMACVDRLVELEEIEEVIRPESCMAQHRVFTMKRR